jgi:hypothetical protein
MHFQASWTKHLNCGKLNSGHVGIQQITEPILMDLRIPPNIQLLNQ